jgi:hypothetical protein
MEDENSEALVVPTERLRDPETGQYLSRPSKNYIESRQAHKEKITKALQDIMAGPEADLEPLESDSAYMALLKAQIKNGIKATGRDAGPAIKLLEHIGKVCGLEELPPAEINSGVKIVLINFPENMMNKTARPYVEHQTLLEPTFAAEPRWAEVTEITQNPAPAPALPKKILTTEEQRKLKFPHTFGS